MKIIEYPYCITLHDGIVCDKYNLISKVKNLVTVNNIKNWYRKRLNAHILWFTCLATNYDYYIGDVGIECSIVDGKVLIHKEAYFAISLGCLKLLPQTKVILGNPYDYLRNSDVLQKYVDKLRKQIEFNSISILNHSDID